MRNKWQKSISIISSRRFISSKPFLGIIFSKRHLWTIGKLGLDDETDFKLFHLKFENSNRVKNCLIIFSLQISFSKSFSVSRQRKINMREYKSLLFENVFKLNISSQKRAILRFWEALISFYYFLKRTFLDCWLFISKGTFFFLTLFSFSLFFFKFFNFFWATPPTSLFLFVNSRPQRAVSTTSG